MEKESWKDRFWRIIFTNIFRGLMLLYVFVLFFLAGTITLREASRTVVDTVVNDPVKLLTRGLTRGLLGGGGG